MAKLNDELRKVRLVRPYARLREGGVQLYLFRGHRLYLDDLLRSRSPREVDSNLPRLRGVARPVNDSSSRRAVPFELLKVFAEVGHRVLANSLARFTKLLPVGHLVNNDSSLVLDHVRSVTHILAQLRVAQKLTSGNWKHLRCSRIERSVAQRLGLTRSGI